MKTYVFNGMAILVFGVIAAFSLLGGMSGFTTTGLEQILVERNSYVEPEVSPAISEGVVINEIMPIAREDLPAWVELYHHQIFTAYLPLFLQGPTDSIVGFGNPTRAEGDDFEIELNGWQVTNETGQVYAIPEDLPPVPPNAYVLIYFDGLGPDENDYDFSDGIATLHTPPGLEDMFDPEAGQAGLYQEGELTAETIVDFVAWGDDPGDAAENAVAADLWIPNLFVVGQQNMGEEIEAECRCGTSLGLMPESPAHDAR